MLKATFSFIFSVVVLIIAAVLLTWLYEAFNRSPFFIFLILIITAGAYSKQSQQIQKLHERIMKLEGFER